MARASRIGLAIGAGLVVVGIVTAVFLSRGRRSESAGAASVFEFDAAGHLVKAVQPGGVSFDWTYDARGLPVEVRFPEGTLRAGYDADGNQAWVRDPTGISGTSTTNTTACRLRSRDTARGA